MREKQSGGSLFAGLPGLAVLLIAALLCGRGGLPLSGGVLLALALLCLFGLLWSNDMLKKASVKITADRYACHAGERVTVKAVLRSGSVLPLLWMEAVLPLGEKPVLRFGESDSAPFFFPNQLKPQPAHALRFSLLLPGWEAECEQEALAVRRGVREMPGVQLQCSGAMPGAQQRWVSFAAPMGFTVWPALYPADVSAFLRGAQEQASRSAGTLTDPTLLRGTRPYQPGDPARSLNWRLLAAGGALQTNLYETRKPGCKVFALNLESFRHYVAAKEPGGEEKLLPAVQEDELERQLSVLASVLRALHEKHVGISLLLPAYGAVAQAVTLPSADDRQLHAALDLLAGVDYRAEDCRFTPEALYAAADTGEICLCTRSDADELPPELTAGIPGRFAKLYLRRDAAAPAAGRCLYAADICRLPREGGGA